MSSKFVRYGPLSKRSPVYEYQASFLANCIHKLDEARIRAFGAGYDPESGDTEKFWALPAYDTFQNAAYACGFVCTDLPPTYPLDSANQSPQETVGRESFPGLRHYIHTLMRAERANQMGGCFSPVLAAFVSGALILVAERLVSDLSLYESPK